MSFFRYHRRKKKEEESFTQNEWKRKSNRPNVFVFLEFFFSRFYPWRNSFTSFSSERKLLEKNCIFQCLLIFGYNSQLNWVVVILLINIWLFFYPIYFLFLLSLTTTKKKRFFDRMFFLSFLNFFRCFAFYFLMF